MLDAKAEVLRRYPQAVVTRLESRELNRKGWVIQRVEWDWDVAHLLGGGMTEEAAWDHALSLILASEAAKSLVLEEIL